mmetsp:Transcript_60120/g.135282  ORF Transcript_60120/g.135282 Transcript_60120/m.135282 type:complete len:219 (-) Transcript_60120:55-711(-)
MLEERHAEREAHSERAQHNPWDGQGIDDHRNTALEVAEEWLGYVMRAAFFKAFMCFCFRCIKWHQWGVILVFWCIGVNLGQTSIDQGSKVLTTLFVLYCSLCCIVGIFVGIHLVLLHLSVWIGLMSVDRGHYPPGYEKPTFWFHIKTNDENHWGLFRFFVGLLASASYCLIVEPVIHIMAACWAWEVLRQRQQEESLLGYKDAEMCENQYKGRASNQS